MSVEWDLIRSGPDDAEHGVLLLPGGACSASSYRDVMAQPALQSVRLVAATLPGHVGTPPPDDFSIENYARLVVELADHHQCDVVAGYSMGASVALEMAASGAFRGPVVLMGISLSAHDEPAFFRAIVRLDTLFGSLPSAALVKMSALATRMAHVPDERRVEIRAEFRRNDPRVLRHGLRAYLDYLESHPMPAERLCDARVPTWIVHAEKGDGSLTDAERRTLEGCPYTTVITIPGTSFLLPDEEPKRVAEVIATAIAAVAPAA